MGPRTILYVTVKFKILAVLPETDNFIKSLSPQIMNSQKYS